MNKDILNEYNVLKQIQKEGKLIIKNQKITKNIIENYIFFSESFFEILAKRLSYKLVNSDYDVKEMYELFKNIYKKNNILIKYAINDLFAVIDRDPACKRLIEPLLYFKGFHAIQIHRINNYLYNNGEKDISLFFQMLSSEKFSVDIHPAANIGSGLMIDHAHSIAIGETAEIGNNVSILHSVTLGGTGKENGQRHPKILDGVLIGAGASILGNITVGKCSRIAAGSVVLSDVPELKTVAGVPAKIVGESGCDQPSILMNQHFN